MPTSTSPHRLPGWLRTKGVFVGTIPPESAPATGTTGWQMEMTDSLRSILQGTSALSVALALALGLTLARPARIGEATRRLVGLVLVAIGLQAVHFVEELLTGFRSRFPQSLGLAAWPSSFFVVFNLLWLAIWLGAAAGLRRGVRLALFPIWFLAIAMTVNGPAHVILALRAGGYFPGLISAPLEAAVGAILLARLLQATARHPPSRTPTSSAVEN